MVNIQFCHHNTTINAMMAYNTGIKKSQQDVLKLWSKYLQELWKAMSKTICHLCDINDFKDKLTSNFKLWTCTMLKLPFWPLFCPFFSALISSLHLQFYTLLMPTF
uniref:Uncharacterized protein n=1 Tax=Oryza brachyantha TaxID=4533 RepID=J3MLE1_ORYBR